MIDIITELKEFGCSVDVCDPLADPAEVQHEYGIDLTLCENLALADYEGIVLAVGHNQFKQLDIASLRAKNVIIYDVKSLFDKQHVNERL